MCACVYVSMWTYVCVYVRELCVSIQRELSTREGLTIIPTFLRGTDFLYKYTSSHVNIYYFYCIMSVASFVAPSELNGNITIILDSSLI